ncbi:helix-turn-helix transcriptional regulator [Epilithonimonas sp. JDS]|uniref:helix-turn-helix domain-containing protein n=1 Tax=Epilithonimonas sp. JDS TaxID=2902797 RepID=UPI001E471E8B|nr:helix-turn-helix transcriptional regulator [Epilithonimonas sp. JDS]MCD9853916.1 helix-turn-helix transcriptional regulator [Epilithonimonas sp. JDS]
MIRKKRGNLTPHQSSIVLNLKPILAARNILHPAAYLRKLGINAYSADKILNGEAVQINFRQLTTLCISLNCTPNDLFALRDIQLPENHQLNKLQDISVPAINPEEFYKGKSLEEIRAMGELKTNGR